MTVLLMLLMTVVLLFLSFALFRQTIFLALIKDTPENRHFLRVYGYFFLGLALFSIFLAILNHVQVNLFFIAGLLLISAVFSLQFVKKMR